MLRTITLYEQLSYFESSNDFGSELDALYNDLLGIRNSLDQQVNGLVGSLHAQIVNDKLTPKTGIMNGIKKWWSNLFGGRNKKSNPYYWQNKIGALGRTDIEPPTVEEYRIMNDLATSLAEAVATSPQPVITKIINNWSGQLRNVVSTHLDNMMGRVRQAIMRVHHAVKDRPAPKLPENPKSEKPKPADAVPTPTASSSRIPSAPMPDVDDVPVPGPRPSPAPTPTAASPAAGMTPRYVEIGGVKTKFDDLPAAVQRAILDREEEGDPTDAKKPDAPKDATHDATHDAPKGDDILSDDNLPVVRDILSKHKGVSIEKIKSGEVKLSPEEERIVMAVHKPWLDLDNDTRKNLNMRGRNGIPMSSNNKGKYPFRLPPVLRKNDPRIGILKRYYPDLFQNLELKGKIEHDGDDEMEIRERIKKIIRKGEEDGEYKVQRAKPKEKLPTPPDRTASHMPSDKDDTEPGVSPKRKFDTAPMPANDDDDKPVPKSAMKERTSGYPKTVGAALRDLASKDEEKAHKVADAWETLTDKLTKSKFKKLMDAGEYDEAIALADHAHDDDEVADMFSHYQPKGPPLAEALVRRLRLQREGKAEQWMPTRDVSPKKLVERLRQQSAKAYAES